MKNQLLGVHIIYSLLKLTCSNSTVSQCRQGLPGPPGEDGFPGPYGRPGKPGKPGNPGKDGLSGKDGTEGPPGQIGYRGPPGPPGPYGMEGEKGQMGEKGRRGEEGPQGTFSNCSLPQASGIQGLKDLATLKIVIGVIAGCLMQVLILTGLLLGFIVETRKELVDLEKNTDERIRTTSPVEERDTASYVRYRASTGSAHIYQGPTRLDEVPPDRDRYTGLINRAMDSTHEYQTTTQHEYQATTDNSQEYQTATDTIIEYHTANIYSSVIDEDLESSTLILN